jgi:hypothetical protein
VAFPAVKDGVATWGVALGGLVFSEHPTAIKAMHNKNPIRVTICAKIVFLIVSLPEIQRIVSPVSYDHK